MDDEESDDEDDGPPLATPHVLKFIDYLCYSSEQGRLTKADLYNLRRAIATLGGEETEETVRIPIRPGATQGSQPRDPRAPVPLVPQTRKVTRTPGTAPASYAAAAATPSHNIVPKNMLPSIIQKVNKLRKDFPSISETDAIRYASTSQGKADEVAMTQC